MKGRRLQLARDLQCKIADDITHAMQRVVNLTEDEEIVLTVMVQAATTANRHLAHAVEHVVDRDSAAPMDETIVLACLLCARLLVKRPDTGLLDLMTASMADVHAMRRAGIILPKAN